MFFLSKADAYFFDSSILFLDVNNPDSIKQHSRKKRVGMLKGSDYEKIKKKLPKTKEYIQFKTNSSAILSNSYNILKEYGSAIENGVSNSKLIIEGHTDSRGSKKNNMKLSYRRAKSVKYFLTNFYKISPDRLIIKSFGESKPISTNMNKKGRALNRRVEFIRIQ